MSNKPKHGPQIKIEKAIRLAGSQLNLAKQLDVVPATVSVWGKRGKTHIPAPYNYVLVEKYPKEYP